MSIHDAADKAMLGDAEQIFIPGWLVGWLGAIGTALAGAVVFLFKALSSNYAKQLEDTIARHDAEIGELKCDRDMMKDEAGQCRKDREELRSKVAELATRIEFLEPKQ